MKKYNQTKKNFYYVLIMFFILSLCVGYAVLTQQLSINNIVNYDAMKWDVGFTSAVDGEGSIKSLSAISSDKKSVTVTCDVGTSTSSETCIVKATITNASTFNIMLREVPTIAYDDTYISSVDVMWLKSFEAPKKLDGINNGKSEDVQIKITTKELEESMLPEESISISISIVFDWIEADGSEKNIVSLIGQEITFGEEKFNVISADEDTITMLAQYNIGTNYRQSSIERDVTFSYSNGWEYAPGPKEIDIQQFDGEVKNNLNEYVSYLKTVTGDSNLTGNLISLRELKALGCTIAEDYSYTSGFTCVNSDYKSWLVNGQYWWTRSALSSISNNVWVVNATGSLSSFNYREPMGGNGVRPVITILKETLEKSIISFKISENEYYAEEGMTWGEWVNSLFNKDNFIVESSLIKRGDVKVEKNNKYVKETDLIIMDTSYTTTVCCFDAGSKVLMADGTTKNIEDVKVGDLVMSLNEDTGEYIVQRVTGTVINKNSTDLVYVHLSDGTKIGMRAYHPLLTTEGWKSLRPNSFDLALEGLDNLSLLEVGDTLVGYEENVTVVSIEQRPEVENYYTYNLSVEGYHNYIVEGIVAHNVKVCNGGVAG